MRYIYIYILLDRSARFYTTDPFTNPKMLRFTMLFNRSVIPKVPLLVGHLHPHVIDVLWTTQRSIPNCISIGSAVFAQLTADSLYFCELNVISARLKNAIAGINVIN